MRLRSLPPVGRNISLKKSEPQSDSNLLSEYDLHWLGSGTQALAFALVNIRDANPSVEKPAVVIPGYCCPDLLSAALFAGFRPVVVDICEHDPSYDLNALSDALNDTSVLAIIAINFLGIAERLDVISALIADRNIALIEDNAQWFPDEHEEALLKGDYVTFSFGRGKAINLLGGGLVAVRKGLPGAADTIRVAENSQAFVLKALLLNQILNPVWYYWLQKLTFLNLGATVFHPLETIDQMPEQQRDVFATNLHRYRLDERHAEKAHLTGSATSRNLLARILESNRTRRMLRFPLLLESEELRNSVLGELNQQGLGASSMYQAELSKVAGVADLGVAFPDLPNAASFARRLITLPVHEHVTAEHINTTQDCIERHCTPG